MGNLKLNAARGISILLIAGFLSIGFTSLAQRDREFEQKTIQLNQLQSDKRKLDLELKNTLQEKNINLEKVKTLEKESAVKEQKIKEQEAALQAKAAAKSSLAKLAAGQTASAAAPAPSGSCQDWMRQAGITDMNRAYTLIMRESGCRVNADNPGSDAYGIPQALPGSKMASHGADWATNPVTQLRWMQDYVMGRYGSWANALSHSYSYNWY